MNVPLVEERSLSVHSCFAGSQRSIAWRLDTDGSSTTTSHADARPTQSSLGACNPGRRWTRIPEKFVTIAKISLAMRERLAIPTVRFEAIANATLAKTEEGGRSINANGPISASNCLVVVRAA